MYELIEKSRLELDRERIKSDEKRFEVDLKFRCLDTVKMYSNSFDELLSNTEKLLGVLNQE